MGSSRDSSNRYSSRTPRGSRRVRVVRSRGLVKVFDRDSIEDVGLGTTVGDGSFTSFDSSECVFIGLCIVLFLVVVFVFVFDSLVGFERFFYIG